MKNKILFISAVMTGGGAERVVSVLSDGLVRRGYDVGVFIYYRSENEYKLNKDVKVFTFDPSVDIHSPNPVKRRRSRRRYLRKFIADHKPDCCVPFLEGISKEVYFSARGLNIPMIATLRNITVDRFFFDKPIRNYVYSRVSAVFLQTEAQKAFFPQNIQDRSFVVGNPVSEAMLRVGENREYKERIEDLVSLGRLMPQKNQKIMIYAMREVHEKHPEVRLSIYGEGPEEEKLRGTIKEIGAEGYIFLKGRTNDAAGALKEADMFVFSSDYEGMPNALLEAMAAGLPCVSTDCPTGPKDLIGENERGLLVPLRDTKALSEAIINLLENNEYAVSLGKKAHTFVSDNFNVDVITEQFIENCRKWCYLS